MKEKKSENRNQRYNDFHEKHKAPVKFVSVNVPSDIADAFNSLSDSDQGTLHLVLNQDILDCLYELVLHPMESRDILDSIFFQYIELVNIHEAPSIGLEEINMFYRLSNLFKTCFKYQEGLKTRKGGQE